MAHPEAAMNGRRTLRRLPRRFFIYGFGLAVMLSLIGTGLFLLRFKPAPSEVVVSGPAAQMGEQYGRTLSSRMRLLVRVYLDRIICQNDRKLIASRRAIALKCLTNWPAAYSQELHSVAKTSGLDPGALAYANCFLDLGQAQAACRSVVISSSNLFLHAHNLDWDNLGGLGRWTTCIVRRYPADGRFATVAVGFPGLVGALDIINEKGLALSFNQLGVGRGQIAEPIFVFMRRVAETCASLDEARVEIGRVQPGMPFIIAVSDAAAGTGAVFERTRTEISERPLTNGWVAACNVAQGTKPGLTRLDRVLAAAPVSDTAELRQVLGHPEVLMGCNIYSVIFDFRRNQLLIASGSIPAAIEPFRRFPLFP